MKEHFVELQQFITFSLTQQIGQLKSELKGDVARLETRIERLEIRFDRLEKRVERLEERVTANHEAVVRILSDILSRLPPARG